MSTPKTDYTPTKEELEREKLSLQIKKLKGHFYEDREWWVKFLALFFGFLTILATIKYSGLIRDVKVLTDERDTLTREKKAVNADLDRLKQEKGQLEREKDSLHKETEELADKLSMQEFRTRLGFLEQAAASPLTSSLPQPITNFIEFLRKDRRYQEKYLALLQDALKSAKTHTAKAAMLIILFEARRDAVWRYAIAEELLDAVKRQPSSGEVDFDTPNAAFMLTRYAQQWKESDRLALSQNFLSLVSLQQSASARGNLIAVRLFRQIWLDEINLESVLSADLPDENKVRVILGATQMARNIALDPNPSVSLGERLDAIRHLTSLSHEGCAVVMARILADPKTPYSERLALKDYLYLLSANFDTTGIRKTSSVPQTVEATEWSVWAGDNSELIELYLEPGVKKLWRELRDKILEKQRETN